MPKIESVSKKEIIPILYAENVDLEYKKRLETITGKNWENRK